MWPVVAQLSLWGVERPIGSYGVMLTVALLAGSITTLLRAHRDGLDAGRVIAVTGVALAAAMAGASVLFAFVELARTGQWPWNDGRFGLVFFGSALGGAAGLWLGTRWLQLPTATMFDHAAVGLAVGQVLGRVGCLLGGCCYGVPWHGLDGHGLAAVTYTHSLAPAAHPSVPRAPTPLLEAALVALLMLTLLAMRQRRHWSAGTLALRYATGYAIARLLLEGLRGDGVRGVMFDGMLSTSQAIALATLATLLIATRRERPVGRALAMSGLLGLVATNAGHDSSARAQLVLHAPAVIQIEAGWFTLGSTQDDIEAAIELCTMDLPHEDLCAPTSFVDELPARRVYLSTYRMDRTEVSNAAYARCVAANVCTPSRLPQADPRVSDPELPVTGITAAQAERYCAWLGGTLPTEAQWEKAARGSAQRRFPWGDLWNSRLCNHGRGMGDEDPIDGYRRAAPVDAYNDARSPYGLLNMAGNVAELTADYYDERGYGSVDELEPRSTVDHGDRVIRGGSWRSPAFTLRTTDRAHLSDNDAQADVGFRCAYRP